MKLFAVLIGLLCCVGLLQSCDKENEVRPEKSKEDIWYWGYFKGEVSGAKISLENQDHNGPIRSISSSYHFAEEGKVMSDSVNIMGTLIRYNDNSELRITLYDLLPGERYLTLSGSMYWYESCIKATVFTDSSQKTVKADYVPSEENPFRVEITDVLWLSSTRLIIEVKLDGVLYNKENPDDVIVIKGAYGTR